MDKKGANVRRCQQSKTRLVLGGTLMFRGGERWKDGDEKERWARL